MSDQIIINCLISDPHELISLDVDIFWGVGFGVVNTVYFILSFKFLICLFRSN